MRRLFAMKGSVDLALLFIRLGIGLSMAIFHGYGKITGGSEMWTRVGGAMQNLGIHFTPVLWGFMAAFAEFFCSILLVLGLFFRPAAALLAFAMFVAALNHLNLPADHPATGWSGASHALELFAVYVALFAGGAGKYTAGWLVRSLVSRGRVAQDPQGG